MTESAQEKKVFHSQGNSCHVMKYIPGYTCCSWITTVDCEKMKYLQLSVLELVIPSYSK